MSAGQVELYGGLLLFCGFILYDTQLIIERRRRGDKDYVWHSLMLFVDFVDVFRHILVILMQKEVGFRGLQVYSLQVFLCDKRCDFSSNGL